MLIHLLEHEFCWNSVRASRQYTKFTLPAGRGMHILLGTDNFEKCFSEEKHSAEWQCGIVAMENQYKSLLIYLYLAFLKFALELFSCLHLFSIICTDSYGYINQVIMWGCFTWPEKCFDSCFPTWSNNNVSSRHLRIFFCFLFILQEDINLTGLNIKPCNSWVEKG